METIIRHSESSQIRYIGKFVLSVLVMFFQSSAMGQTETGHPFMVYPSFGVGIGFFYPRDVNTYIEESLGSYSIEFGTTDIFTYYQLHAGLTFRWPKIDLTGLFEFATAPKIIMVKNADENISFYFNRFSPGVTINYYFPISGGKQNIFIGGGFQYHVLKFEDYKARNIGFRVQSGADLIFGKFNLQPFGAFQYARAKDKDATTAGDFVLNYTGVQIGVFLSFHGSVQSK